MLILYYNHSKIGTSEKDFEDFPSFFGKMIDFETNVPKKIEAYIDYSKISCDLLDNDSEKSEVFEKENEAKFDDLIDADWKIADENNQSVTILIPLFRKDNSIVWRLKID